MEHRQAQKRMLVCAALFSFGTLCGALTFLNLPFPASEQMWNSVSGFFRIRQFIVIPAAFCLGPLLMIVLGLSAAGFVFSDLLLIFHGFAAGFTCGILFRFGQHSFICFAFLLIPCVYLVMTSACIRRISFLSRAQIRSGGLLRPDYGYDFLRIGSYFCIRLMSAFALSYYLLSL